jgi:hypothetical protein
MLIGIDNGYRYFFQLLFSQVLIDKIYRLLHNLGINIELFIKKESFFLKILYVL